ncbi:MAG: flagellar biosynthetic protein FliO [Alicyclobacillus sp.]|nr:flagellar biosynthetic protein FliO [Alicyclobacillus sp.]
MKSALGSPVSAVVHLVLSLALVVVLAVLAIRFLAKRSRTHGGGGIDVVAWRQVGPNRTVQVIDVGGRRLLIGVGEDVTLLADVSDRLLDRPLQTGGETGSGATGLSRGPRSGGAEGGRGTVSGEAVYDDRFAAVLRHALGQVRDRYRGGSGEAVD